MKNKVIESVAIEAPHHHSNLRTAFQAWLAGLGCCSSQRQREWTHVGNQEA
jgi:hypothetical protein